MFKKTMSFDNLNEEEVTQTFYFNYNKKEVAELLEFGHLVKFPPPAGVERLPLEQQLERLGTPVEESGLSNIDNNIQAYTIFQGLILDAYGEKGDDNVSFVKNERTRAYLENHVAFDDMIFEFLGNERLMAEFIEKCLPPKLVAGAKADMERENAALKGKTLAEMVEEANRRQQDPATRIEPGPEAAADALGENPEVATLAEQVKDAPAKKLKDLTPQDIAEMDADAFGKLDIKKLNKEQLFAAFARKSAG